VPPFDHSKLHGGGPGQWCFVGSTNWDMRSFRLNFEVNRGGLPLAALVEQVDAHQSSANQTSGA
jgi:hypothetical protein